MSKDSPPERQAIPVSKPVRDWMARWMHSYTLGELRFLLLDRPEWADDETHRTESAEWMRHRCDLSGADFALRAGAPVPFVDWGLFDSDGNSVTSDDQPQRRDWTIHPDIAAGMIDDFIEAVSEHIHRLRREALSTLSTSLEWESLLSVLGREDVRETWPSYWHAYDADVRPRLHGVRFVEQHTSFVTAEPQVFFPLEGEFEEIPPEHRVARVGFPLKDFASDLSRLGQLGCRCRLAYEESKANGMPMAYCLDLEVYDQETEAVLKTERRGPYPVDVAHYRHFHPVDTALLLPVVPVAVARRMAYLWLLCFRLDDVARFLHDYDATLLDKLRKDDPMLQQQHKAALDGVYAIEQALGTGNREELIQPYKSLLAHLSNFFHKTGWVEMPKGLYGWRLFFLERGWGDEPPDWIKVHIERSDKPI